MIWDDQNLIVNVNGKGLVIVSGCSHAGAVNVMRNAQRLTGGSRRGLHRRLSPHGRALRDDHRPDGRRVPRRGGRPRRTGPLHGLESRPSPARALSDAFVQPAIKTLVTF